MHFHTEIRSVTRLGTIARSAALASLVAIAAIPLMLSLAVVRASAMTNELPPGEISQLCSAVSTWEFEQYNQLVSTPALVIARENTSEFPKPKLIASDDDKESFTCFASIALYDRYCPGASSNVCDGAETQAYRGADDISFATLGVVCIDPSAMVAWRKATAVTMPPAMNPRIAPRATSLSLSKVCIDLRSGEKDCAWRIRL